MDERTKELIAIGVSVGTHCNSCLDFHMTKARELEIDEDDVRAAIEVGYMVEKGASMAIRDYVGKLEI